LTPEEYRKKLKKRKKKKAISSPARKVPKVEVCESNVLEGLSFCVLEGLYFWDANWYDTRAARADRWMHVAEKVKTEEDVIKFVKKHGGSYKAEVTGVPMEYIVGGSKDDARVKMQINGLKHAKSLIGSKKKADQKLASVARCHDGILKWTFVYFLVHRLQEAKKEPSKYTRDTYLVPEPQHYLVRASGDESIEEALFSVNRPMLVDEMEHLLSAPTVAQNDAWQSEGSMKLPKELRWVLSSKFTLFWQCGIDASGKDKTAVVYPDVFSSGFGFSSEKDASDEAASSSRSARWDHVESSFDEITSTLPLVSAMGGLITPHLHSGVTHVICFLKADNEVSIEDANSYDTFVRRERGRCLMEYLDHHFPQNSGCTLISPNWIRNKLNDLV